jgi:hypothetical protein
LEQNFPALGLKPCFKIPLERLCEPNLKQSVVRSTAYEGAGVFFWPEKPCSRKTLLLVVKKREGHTDLLCQISDAVSIALSHVLWGTWCPTDTFVNMQQNVGGYIFFFSHHCGF